MAIERERGTKRQLISHTRHWHHRSMPQHQPGRSNGSPQQFEYGRFFVGGSGQRKSQRRCNLETLRSKILSGQHEYHDHPIRQRKNDDDPTRCIHPTSLFPYTPPEWHQRHGTKMAVPATNCIRT